MHLSIDIPESATSSAIAEVAAGGNRTVQDKSAFVREKLADMKNMLEGDVMSIPRDPDLAYGQSTLCFRDLAFAVKSKSAGPDKVVLTPTSGAFATGSMVALMVRKGPGRTGGSRPVSYEQLPHA
jgi:hypothetical protein